MKTFFNLTGEYEGFRARRLKQFGNVVLYQIINDLPHYWLVMIKGFDPDRHIAQGIINPRRIATWRFLDLGTAKAKFAQLAGLPWCIEDEKRAENTRTKNSERLKAIRDSGQAFGFAKSAGKTMSEATEAR